VEGIVDNKTTHITTEIKKVDGEPMIIEGDYISIYDTEGRIKGTVGVQSDVTFKKKAENRIRESEERYRVLVESQTDLVASINFEGIFTFINEACCKNIGKSYNELIGTSFEPCVYEDDIPLIKSLLKTIKRPPYRKRVEIRLNTVSGIRWISWEGSVIKNENGEIIEVQATGRDITAQKEAQEELKKAHDELEKRVEIRTAQLLRANEFLEKEIAERKKTEEEKSSIMTQLFQAQKMEALGVLAGGVSHDFNNLMSVISGYSQIIMWDLGEKHAKYNDIKEIYETAMRASRLTRQLLLFSRQEVLEKIPISMNKIIEEMMGMIVRIIGEDIIVRTDLEKIIWTINADAGNIEQVIMNLVVNSRDALKEGGKINITTKNVILDEDYSKILTYARSGKFVCLSIEDNGCGIDKEILPHIFEPFFTTKGQGKGTGLGLSVVYGIVNQHDGWINVYSELGKGTVFNIYLPAFEVGETDYETDFKENGIYLGKGERILLIEDEEALRVINTRALTEKNYKIFSASNARDAEKIFKIEKGKFDLIFSDVILPDKNGLILVEELLREKPDIKVLFSSGYTGERSRMDLIKEKHITFLQKPYSLKNLLQIIHEILEKM